MMTPERLAISSRETKTATQLTIVDKKARRVNVVCG
jgi:hypothetical protein